MVALLTAIFVVYWRQFMRVATTRIKAQKHFVVCGCDWSIMGCTVQVQLFNGRVGSKPWAFAFLRSKICRTSDLACRRGHPKALCLRLILCFSTTKIVVRMAGGTPTQVPLTRTHQIHTTKVTPQFLTSRLGATWPYRLCMSAGNSANCSTMLMK